MSAALPPRMRAYVAAWVVAAAVVVTPTVVALPARPSPDPALWALLAAVVCVAELIELQFRFTERLAGSFTQIEAAIAAALLLLPMYEAVLAAGVGALAANLLRRRDLAKVAFNTAQVTLATFLASAVLTGLPSLGPVVGRHAILPLAVAMAVYSVVNLAGLSGLLRLMGADVRTMLRRQSWLSGAALLGGLPVGILGAELAGVRPALVVLLVAPAASMYLAERGAARTQRLLGQVRHDRDRLDRVVDGTSDGILLLDADGTVEVWNDALAELTGVPGHTAVGRPVDDVLDGVRLEAAPSDAWQLASTAPGHATRVERAQLRHAVDGSLSNVRESLTYRFVDGVLEGVVVVVTDLTREQQVAALKDDFVARISHELRTPLTPITGFAELLLKKGDDMTPETRRTALERIASQSARMAALVEDLLLVTEFDRESTGPHATAASLPQVDLLAVTRQVVAAVAEATGRDDICVEADGPVVAHADTDRLAQVLRHLIDNAARYSEPGSQVVVGVHMVGQRARVEVADHGRGIPLREHEQVFAPFQRLEDPMRMTTGGVGVGLHIARRLARDMGGDVTLRSRPGDGSTFTLELLAGRGEGV